MLELSQYKGCYKCELSGKCDRCKVPVSIKFNKPQKWDCGGKMVTVFREGDVVNGYAWILENKAYCAVAESIIYEGIEDFIELEGVEITRID